MQQAFDGVASIIGGVLAFLYSVVPDYSFAIVVLTLLIMAITTPLTLKSTRSMMLMQQMMPEIKKIQSQFKDDRQRQNEEVMKFYKENNLSPAGGCVPMLVQMPVFIVLYQVLQGLTRPISDRGFHTGFGLGQLASGQSVGAAPSLHAAFDPTYLDHSTRLFTSLEGKKEMLSVGVDLSKSAAEQLSTGPVGAIPYLTLIAVVAVTGWYQQKQIQGRNPNAQVDPTQQMLMKIMPFFLPVFSFAMPAGLVLYFVVSNLCRVGLQAYISHAIYGITPGGARGSSPGGATKAGPSTPKDSGPKGATKGGAAGRTTEPKRRTDGANGSQGGNNRAAAKERAGVSATDGGGRGNGKGADKAADRTGAKAGSKAGAPRERAGEQSRSKSTTAAPKGQQNQAKPSGEPTLQPRARKPKKR